MQVVRTILEGGLWFLVMLAAGAGVFVAIALGILLNEYLRKDKKK